MADDVTESPRPGKPDQTGLVQKIAVRFAKTGPAIYHSHHDMIRFWERAVRRADLPMRLTQGFNPRPRMVFPHALGLGVVSRHEEVELELHARMDLADAERRLTGACAGVLEILGIVELPPARKGRQIRESSYRLTGWPAETAEHLDATVEKILAEKEITVLRGAPGSQRPLDIRPFVKGLTFSAADMVVETTFLHNAAGSARLDEIAKLLADAAGIDWRTVVLEKTGMELE